MTTPSSHEDIALEKIIADVRCLVECGCFQSAAKRLGEFRHHLEQHLDTERRLVPLFISRTGDPTGLAQRLRSDHHQLPQRLDAAWAAITRWDGARSLLDLKRLSRALCAHHAAVGALIHPALEDLVPEDADWDTLHSELVSAQR